MRARGKYRVADYAKQVLSLGCLYLELCDTIWEGDGERVLRSWYYLLPIFGWLWLQKLLL